jgi:hypothetical protein
MDGALGPTPPQSRPLRRLPRQTLPRGADRWKLQLSDVTCLRWWNSALSRRISEGAPAAVGSASYWDTQSTTSSTRASNEDGIVRPSALAVVRLTMRWNLFSCSTGSSAGFAPRSTRSTYLAESSPTVWMLAVAGESSARAPRWLLVLQHCRQLLRLRDINDEVRPGC